MELRQVRYFVEAARLLHFTRAAERLHVAQTSLSQQIMALEAELGVRLFDRFGRGAMLTEAGKAFLVRAERILAEAEASEFSGLVRRRVVIGALRSTVNSRGRCRDCAWFVRQRTLTRGPGIRAVTAASRSRIVPCGPWRARRRIC